jgi:hypothetical protein
MTVKLDKEISEYETRDTLVADWWSGKLSTIEAKKIVSLKKWEELWLHTPKSLFDPYLFPTWTLYESIAWLVWRTRDMVIEFDRDYRKRNEIVLLAVPKDFGPRPIIETMAQPTISLLMSFIGFTCDRDQSEIIALPRYGNITEALEAIRVKCIQGDITALGFNGQKQVEIPQSEWEHIAFECGGANRPDGDIARYQQGHITTKYQDLRFDWKQIQDCWPDPSQPQRAKRKTQSVATVSMEIFKRNAEIALTEGDLTETTQRAISTWAKTRFESRFTDAMVRELNKHLAPNGGNKRGKKSKD